jgi:hypothetical protein
MGFSPLQWGRQGWHFIHAVALGYSNTPTEEEKKAASDFINSLTIILPCIHCATNFKEKIEKYPPRLDNSKDFFEWTVDIHNEVNKENGKDVLSYNQALIEFENNAQPNYSPIVKLEIENKTLIPIVAISSGFVGFLMGKILSKK